MDSWGKVDENIIENMRKLRNLEFMVLDELLVYILKLLIRMIGVGIKKKIEL